MRRIGLGLVLVLAAATTAEGQGWMRLPNGELGYVTDYSTSGMWSCSRWFVTRGACSVNGNSVTLNNQGNSLTMTYVPVATRFTASPQGQKISLGTVTKSFTGSGPFIFPQTTTNTHYLDFILDVTEVAPYADSNYWYGGFLLRNNSLKLFALKSIMEFGVTPPPAPATYGKLKMYDVDLTEFDQTEDPMEWTATSNVTPEPATLIMMGSGLAGVFGAVARRRRKA